MFGINLSNMQKMESRHHLQSLYLWFLNDNKFIISFKSSFRFLLKMNSSNGKCSLHKITLLWLILTWTFKYCFFCIFSCWDLDQILLIIGCWITWITFQAFLINTFRLATECCLRQLIFISISMEHELEDIL